MINAILFVRQADGTEKRVPCGRLVTMGRDRTNEIVLADPKVSRSHAVVRQLGDGRHYLMDMGSRNGTFVNDRRVLMPCELEDKDVIRIGAQSLRFSQETGEPESVSSETPAGAVTMLDAAGVLKQATILVADIRGYTEMSGRIPEGMLGSLLGRWCGEVGRIVEMNGGVVDKFIGDAVMARWIAGDGDTGCSVEVALKTAVELADMSTRLSAEFQELPGPLRIGTGINTGRAAVLDVGGAGGGRDYTVLGDAVNMAFRFESASKALKKDVVVGPDSCSFLPREMWENRLQNIEVKGKDGQVRVFVAQFEELRDLLSACSMDDDTPPHKARSRRDKTTKQESS